jgi:hypothetical protein
MRASRAISTGFVLLPLFLAGCSSVKYGSQRVEGGDLSAVKTFCALVAPQDKVPMDPAMREYLTNRVTPAIVEKMKSKGYVQVPEAEADVIVATHALIGIEDVGAIRWNATVMSSWDPWSPLVGGFYATSAVGKKASLMVDIGDPKAKKLLWRGWGTGTGELGAGHDPARIRKVVDNVLAGLPNAKAK